MADKRNDGSGRTDVAHGADGSHDGDAVARGLRNMDHAADRATGAVAEGADRAREKFDRAMDGVKRGAEKARDGVHATTSRVEEAVEGARERMAGARERLDDLRSRPVGELAEDVSTVIREHPGKAVLIAGLCGFVLGSFLASRD